MLSTLGPAKLGMWGAILGEAALQQGCLGKEDIICNSS